MHSLTSGNNYHLRSLVSRVHVTLLRTPVSGHVLEFCRFCKNGLKVSGAFFIYFFFFYLDIQLPLYREGFIVFKIAV